MKTFSLSRAAATAAISATALAPAATAHASDYTTGSNEISSTAAASIFGGLGIFIFVFVAIGIALFVLWILMLIDALQRKNWPDENQKNTWLIILIVSFVIGVSPLAAIIYYFMVRKPLGKASAVATPAPEAPAKK